jgi:hypothetical protein
MCYTAFCIVDGSALSEAIFAELGRSGFTDSEISIASATAPHITGAHHAAPPLPLADAPLPLSVRRSVVGATLGLIAGLTIPPSSETGKVQRSNNPTPVMEGPVAQDFSPSKGDPEASLERVRTLAYHLSPGRDLISVTTSNSYEIETILEIFRAGGALYFSHMVDSIELDIQQASPAAATAVHSHATVMMDRIRDSA